MLKQPKRSATRLNTIMVVATVLIMGCATAVALLFYVRNKPPQLSDWEPLPQILQEHPCVGQVCLNMAADYETVMALLEQDERLSNVQLGGSVLHYITFRPGDGNGTGIIDFSHQGLNSFVDSISYNTRDIPFEAALLAWGEPDELFLIEGCGRKGRYTYINILYREEGIELGLFYPTRQREQGQPFIFNNATPIDEIYYFDPAKYDEWLLLRMEHSGLGPISLFDIDPSITAEALLEFVEPWPGLDTPVQPRDLCMY